MKKKKNLKQRLEELTKKNKDLKVSGKDLVCTICLVNINYDLDHLPSRIREHFNSKSHKKKITESSQQPRIDHSFEQANYLRKKDLDYRVKLCSAMIAADIPLDKLSNPVFRSFLEETSGQKLPCITTLRSVVETIYDTILNKIRSVIGKYNIYMILDETTDIMSRMQLIN